MSTTRHLIDRRRRVEAAAARRREDSVPAQQALQRRKAGSARGDGSAVRTEGPAAGKLSVARRFVRSRTGKADPRPATSPDGRVRGSGRSTLLVGLCCLTLLFGAFAVLGAERASSASGSSRTDTALLDSARTSEVKGQAAEAVSALFSYDHTDPAASEKAAKSLLTGKAVGRHRDLLAAVRSGGEKQKLVVTTTVTDSAVERLQGDLARVLVYADQTSTSTAGAAGKRGKDADDNKGGKGGAEEKLPATTVAGAVLSLNLTQEDGRWLVSGIDTFGG